MSVEEKFASLGAILKDTGGVLVAFSGGVDSTFLAKAAFDVLGQRSMAVTVASEIHPAFEAEEAVVLARDIGIRHKVIRVKALDIEGLAENPPDRCYICKRAILSRLTDLAREEGLPVVVEGSNASDTGDFRPGMKAVKEFGVRSPLFEAGLTKDDIRELSCRMGLPTWNKPSYACLASRIPYGERITDEKLRAVERAEDYLRAKGYRVFRVRHHGKVARIELAPGEMKRFLAVEDLDHVAQRVKEFGFSYVALDLEGYRTGSLNEPLGKPSDH